MARPAFPKKECRRKGKAIMGKQNKQIRSFDITAAQNNNSDEMRVEGYACTFEQPYVLYENCDGAKLYEVIDRNAFDGADLSDVIMQYNHSGKVLARNTNSSLTVEVDNRGLKISADLSRSVSARELYEEIKNGLVTKMSFAFDVREDNFDKDTRTIRLLRFGKIYDVSAVSYPANDNTEIEARGQKYERYFKEDDMTVKLLQLKAKLI